MHFLKWHKWEILIGILLTFFHFLFRLPALTELPIFTDEAIYLRWAQIALNDANWRFISLTDGKQPLFIWAVMIMMKFIEDPILAGRLVSVIAGFFTMVGLWFLSYELFKKKEIAFLASALYVFFPFAVVHDRLALYESMVGAFSVWALYVSVMLVRTLRVDTAYTLGLVIGAGVITKTNAFFSLYSLPFTLLLLPFSKKTLKKSLIRWVLLVAIVIFISQGFYLILRLSPFFHIIEQKNHLFILPFSEWIQEPFKYIFGNARGLLNWLFEYLTIFYTALIVIAFIFVKYFWREKIMLFLYFVFPLAGLIVFGRIVFPRYLFPMVLMLLPVASWSLYFLAEKIENHFKLKGKLGSILVMLLAFFVAYPAYISYSFITDPIHAKISKPDSGQYVNNWSAGWGVAETIDLLEKESEKGPVFVGTFGTFGLMPAALELYLKDNKNVTIKGYWPPEDSLPREVLDAAETMPTFFILYQPQNSPTDSYPTDLVFEKRAGKSEHFFRLYKVRAKK